MTDKIEKLGQSVIHHGSFNNRIYLMKYGEKEGDKIPSLLIQMAIEKGYTKIIVKVPAKSLPLFLIEGYQIEATIPRYYKGNEDVLFLSKYLDSARSNDSTNSLKNISQLLKNIPSNGISKMDEQFTISELHLEQAEVISQLYSQVFLTYPFPITEPAYIQETMQEGLVKYFGVWHQGKLAGLSSAEIDHENQNAEMTDFAVLPAYQGKKLAAFLLKEMEKEMIKMKLKTLYTIARLQSPGMNKTFLNLGYHFSGLLVNNTNISGNIESMNVYYKNIQPCWNSAT